jgi:D-beta-D-heptose 7-phosphate kinase/D-beta-D-heptose 1-phosphate adenosyltransferase
MRAKVKAEGKKVVFTNGVFDLIHSGHVDYLLKAKKLGDVLIVGLNSDESVKRIKGDKRPILKQDERAFILSIHFTTQPYNLHRKAEAGGAKQA